MRLIINIINLKTGKFPSPKRLGDTESYIGMFLGFLVLHDGTYRPEKHLLSPNTQYFDVEQVRCISFPKIDGRRCRGLGLFKVLGCPGLHFTIAKTGFFFMSDVAPR